MYVPMRLARIVITEIGDQQAVFLKEIDGARSLPIVIGLFEATSIERRARGETTQRPLTHDLLRTAIEELGGEAQDVVITRLVDHTYYAEIRIRQNGDLVSLDSRPSDALALAMHYDEPLPIFVSEEVLNEAS